MRYRTEHGTIRIFEQIGPSQRSVFVSYEHTRSRGPYDQELEDEVAQPELKLVPRRNKQQRATDPTGHESGFLHPWRQEARGFSRQVSTLVFILISGLVLFGFLFLYNKLQILSTPTPPPGPPEYLASDTLYVFSKPGLIAKNRVGACDVGTRARVIGTKTVDGDVWYEIEILSKHPANIDSVKQKWVLGSRLVMARS